MRILTWNIGHGGGARIPQVCRHITDIAPDMLALTEFQTRNEPQLRAHLERTGYGFIVTSRPPDRRNGLLLASKTPIAPAKRPTPDLDGERWLEVRCEALDLEALVVHVPGSDDNKFKDGYGISGTKRKELFWQRVVAWAEKHRTDRALILGDFNTGFRIDAQGTPFKHSNYMAELISTGFVDTWRHRHPEVRDFTWYSKRKDPDTGISQDLNGFRLDYLYVSQPLVHVVGDVDIQHAPRHSGASDHASVLLELDLNKAVQAPETLATRPGGAPEETARRSQVVPMIDSGNHQIQFDLDPGALPDMICGLNGANHQQAFRPIYVTAEWASGVLREVRIWGPRLLQDGSLGKRELDHLWRRPIRAGGVDYRELPGPVATQLRSHAAANGRLLPDQT